MNSIKELTGVTAFLNGEPGLHDSMDLPVYNKMKEYGLEVLLVDNLFEAPSELKRVVKASNLVLFTTGIHSEKLKPLIQAFEKLKYTPKNVIFITDDTTLTFAYEARALKGAGTKFYEIDFMDKETLYEISWL